MRTDQYPNTIADMKRGTANPAANRLENEVKDKAADQTAHRHGSEHGGKRFNRTRSARSQFDV